MVFWTASGFTPKSGPSGKIDLERISRSPFAHSVRYQDTRIANVSIFPYGVHYIVEEDTIIIIAIYHIAINPEKWGLRWNFISNFLSAVLGYPITAYHQSWFYISYLQSL